VDLEYVRLQLRCGGVVEAARVARAGYPARLPFPALLRRFRCLLPATAAADMAVVLSSLLSGAAGAGTSAGRRAAAVLLAACWAPAAEYRLGRTKVFFRAGALEWMETRLATAHAAAAVRLQCAARTAAARRRAVRARAVRPLQAAARRRAARGPYVARLLRERRKERLALQTLQVE
jgi:myosin heavy subunit